MMVQEFCAPSLVRRSVSGSINVPRVAFVTSVLSSFNRTRSTGNEFNGYRRRAADAVTNVYVDAKENMKKGILLPT